MKKLLKSIRLKAAETVVDALNILPKRVLALIRDRIEVTGRLDYPKAEIFLSIDSMIEQQTRLKSCRKEPETVEWIEKEIRPGDVVFDVGANVGAYSLIVDKHTKGRSKVYCFEPNTHNLHKLSRNININQCQGRLLAVPVALSNATSLERLELADLKAGSALHHLGGKEECGMVKLSETALVFRLDDFVKTFALPLPQHLKIDVDGHELKVLEGAREVLSNPNVKTALIEIDDVGENQKRVIEYMTRLGFFCGERHAHSSSPTRFGNFIFRRSSVPVHP